MRFCKFSACGNDFIVVDNRSDAFSIAQPDLVAQLCHRRTGIGADGVILLCASAKADYRMRIFNADGSEAEMCGNGIRCLLPFLKSLGVTGNSYRIETMQRILRIAERGDAIAVEMGPATDIRWDVLIAASTIGHCLNTGVPHLVTFVDDVERIDVEREGRELRYHALFAPQGVNVNFVARTPDGFALRTYERGVEAETLACGTGATATALAIAKTTGLRSPISLMTRSGESLTISFQRTDHQFYAIELCGPARCVYHGEVSLFNRD